MKIPYFVNLICPKCRWGFRLGDEIRGKESQIFKVTCLNEQCENSKKVLQVEMPTVDAKEIV